VSRENDVLRALAVVNDDDPADRGLANLVADMIAEVRAETYRAAAVLAHAGAPSWPDAGRNALEACAGVLLALAKEST